MKGIFLVGLGGGLGAIARYKIGGIILRHSIDWKFPLSTFIVNVSGCFIAGILAGLAEKYDLFKPDLRLFLFTGLLGGFTTFSAFGLETVYLFQRNEPFMAIFNILLSLVFGVLCLWFGLKIIPS